MVEGFDRENMKNNMKEYETNCHGCKWLDEVKAQDPGNGYCCMVERSKSYKPGMRARYSNMERCELYEKGDFATRWQTYCEA